MAREGAPARPQAANRLALVDRSLVLLPNLQLANIVWPLCGAMRDTGMKTQLDAEWGTLTRAERVQRYRQFAQEAHNLALSAAPPSKERHADLARQWELLADAIEKELDQRTRAA